VIKRKRGGVHRETRECRDGAVSLGGRGALYHLVYRKESDAVEMGVAGSGWRTGYSLSMKKREEMTCESKLERVGGVQRGS